VVVAELDPLRDDGLLYANALAAAGVEVTSTVFAGLTHPFFYMAGVVGPAKAARRFVGGELKAAFADRATPGAQPPSRA
jgi:acetyl esterase